MKKVILMFILVVLCLPGCNRKAQNAPVDTVYDETNIEERTGDELRIVAIMNVKPDAINELLPVFQALVQGSQEEDGCISYNLYRDIKDSTKFIMQEEWKSQAAIDFHNNTKHYKKYKEASKGKIDRSEVSVMKLFY